MAPKKRQERLSWVSTPKGKGWFFELFRRGQRNDSDYQSWNCPSWANPHLDATLIDAERSRLPERVFRQEFGGEFLEGSGQVFRNVRECARGRFKEPVRDRTYFAGLDLAKVEDYTVLTMLDQHGELIFLDRFHRIDWALQVNRIQLATKRYNDARVLVDSTGAGEPVFENLRRAGIRCLSYPFTVRSKTALIDHLAIAFERKAIVLPQPALAPELIDELEAFEFSVSDNGKVRTGSPSGFHDDCVIALALAAWRGIRATAFRREPNFGKLPRLFGM